MIDWAVAVWCAASIVALVLAAIGVRDGIADLRALRETQNGRRIVAWMHLRNQLGRLAIAIGWTALGIPALVDDRIVPWSPGIVILVAANIVLAVLAALDLRTRHQLLA